MIALQYLEMVERAYMAGLTEQSSDDEIGRWMNGNASPDVLMHAVRNVDTRGGLGWRIAQLAACPHNRGQCTGILASRGYTGHHNAALFARSSGTVK